MDEDARIHVILSGRVQGVAFRYFAEKWATSLGLKGWVRNLRDGRVEILAEGGRDRLEEFLGRLREGPRSARVEDCEATWGAATGEFPDFRISFPY